MTGGRHRARSVAIATGLFRSLIGLMPHGYQSRHRDETVALFARIAADACADRGTLGVLAVTSRAVADLVMRLPAEYLGRHSRRARGATTPAHERVRSGFETLSRDIFYGLRSLRRNPISSAAAIATLAIGIGLNAAVFSVVDWVLLRPLPYPSPHDLVKVFSAGANTVTQPTRLTYSEFQTFSRTAVLRATTAISTATRVIAGRGFEPAHVVVARVAGDVFGTFGAYPDRGRGFDEREMTAGAAVVVLSQTLWRHRLAADPAVAGRLITIDGRPYTVVGVMPPGRGYPSDADLWRPLTAAEREDDDRDHVMIGRLAAGVSANHASVALATLAHGASGAARTAWVEDLQTTEVREVRAALTVLLASAGLILLIACANLAALLGARGSDRRGEMALRAALGASRGCLVRQLLTENVLLAVAGGGAGLVLGHWTLGLLVTVAPSGLPRLNETVLDGRVVVIGVAATLIVGLVVGLGPSLRASRQDFRSGLGAGGVTDSPGRSRGRRVLVAAQTAMAVVLTISAGLLARSLQHLTALDHGFAPERLLAVDLYLRGNTGGDVRQLFRDLVDTADAVPGVLSAAGAMRLPTEITGPRVQVRTAGFPGHAASTATLRPITPGFFDTVGIPVIDGRAFSIEDGQAAPAVAIVNAAFVREVLAGGRAVGARLTTNIVKPTLTVVGVAGDVTPAGASDRPALYLPVDQLPPLDGSLLVRTAGEPRSIVPLLTARIRSIAPALALDRIRDVADLLDAGRAVTRFNTRLAGAFAVLALLLAAIGVYGLTAGEVAARWRELAVRLALGASRREALWTVIRPGAAALAVGIFVGFAATLSAGPFLRSLLHGVEPTDPPTLLVVPVLLSTVGIVAASLAAARVLRADPAATLRGE